MMRPASRRVSSIQRLLERSADRQVSGPLFASLRGAAPPTRRNHVSAFRKVDGRFKAEPHGEQAGSPNWAERQRRSPIWFALVMSGLAGCHFSRLAPESIAAVAPPPPTTPAESMGSSSPPRNTPPESVAASSQPPEEPPNPIAGLPFPEAKWAELAVPQFEPAVIWYRPSAPVIVIAHGAGGEAEWHCRHFHRIFAGRVTLLCPRGKRIAFKDETRGFYYPDHFALRREVHALVDQFERLVPSAESQRPYVYAGYSQGATMGALAFAESGSLFSKLLLVEGGFADWSNLLVTRFRKSGGQAVLIVCGTKLCGQHAQTAEGYFRKAEVRFRTVWAKGAGHRPDGPVDRLTVAHLPFLLEGDARWGEFALSAED